MHTIQNLGKYQTIFSFISFKGDFWQHMAYERQRWSWFQSRMGQTDRKSQKNIDAPCTRTVNVHRHVETVIFLRRYAVVQENRKLAMLSKFKRGNGKNVLYTKMF